MGMNPRLLRPRASGFNPKSISSLAAWWDASDASTITTVSGAVSQWNDKSGNVVNATQTTANNRPNATTATLNGRAVMSFDGSNDHFTFTGTARQNETQFIVCRSSIVAGVASTQYALADSSSGFGVAAIMKNDGSPTSQIEVNLGGFSAGVTRATYNFTANNPFGPSVISVIRSSAAGGILRTDGTQRATCTTSNSFTLSRIGGIGTTFPLNGYIAEILIYSRALSVSESQRVERYLGKKWGIAVA
jgi:hypothetical protein